MADNDTQPYVDEVWENTIIPMLTDYIRIPNKSPIFDPQWRQNGHMDRAVALAQSWCAEQGLENMRMEVVRLGERTPVLFLEIPGASDDTVLLYGHLDKQPEMTGWREGLGPWIPVRENDRLYGRGGADDGYAVFASVTAVSALRRGAAAHPRCVVLIECCEESGSYDLPHYIDALADRIGSPGLVVCLDSGCGNYDQLWCTTSLRGMIAGTLTVEILTEGVHSGDASGVVPSSFRIARTLLDRIEDETSGDIKLAAFQADIPQLRRREAKRAAAALGTTVYDRFPLVPGAEPMSPDPVELALNRTWRPTLSVTGAGGLPAIENAGNVLRPATALKLSLRLPPTADASEAATQLKSELERDPPYGARVRFESEGSATGWHAPQTEPWLAAALDAASNRRFGKPAMLMGEGGSIPFMGMLGEKFPSAQFMITGVLGPQANAHGPNEFLHIPTAKRLTCCVADVLAAYYAYVSA